MPVTITASKIVDGKRISQSLTVPRNPTPEESQAIWNWVATACDKPGEVAQPPKLR